MIREHDSHTGGLGQAVPPLASSKLLHCPRVRVSGYPFFQPRSFLPSHVRKRSLRFNARLDRANTTVDQQCCHPTLTGERSLRVDTPDWLFWFLEAPSLQNGWELRYTSREKDGRRSWRSRSEASLCFDISQIWNSSEVLIYKSFYTMTQ